MVLFLSTFSTEASLLITFHHFWARYTLQLPTDNSIADHYQSIAWVQTGLRIVHAPETQELQKDETLVVRICS